MIKGTLEMNFKEGIDVNKFIEDAINDEYESKGIYLNKEDIIHQTKSSLSVLFESEYTDNITAFTELDIVESAFGEFRDDGYRSGDAGSFAISKKDGRTIEEYPVYLSRLSSEDMIKELQSRGYNVSKDKSKEREMER